MRLFFSILFLWLVAQTFYFGAFGPDIGFIKAIRPHRVLYILTLLTFVGPYLRAKRICVRKLETQDYLMLGVTVSCTISFILSGAHFDTTVGKNKWLSCLFNITYYPLTTYFMMRALPYSRRTVISVMKFLCLLGVYLSLTGVFEHYEWTGWVWPDYIMDPQLGTQFGRSRGPFMESVAMGRVLTMALGAFLIMNARSTGLEAAFHRTFVLMSLLAVYFTYTRGPWIGCGCLLLAFAVHRTAEKRVVKWILLIAMVGVLSGGLGKLSIFQGTLFNQRQSTFTDRVVTWIVSGNMIQDKPLFGIGFGRFHLEWEKYFHYNVKIDFTGFDGSHNTFLTMGAEVGVPTMLAFLLMNFYMVRMCSTLYRRLGPEMQLEKSLLVMVMGLVTMYVVTGWFSDLRWTTVQNTLIFLLLGIVASLKQDLDRLGAQAFGQQIGARGAEADSDSDPSPVGGRLAADPAPVWDLPAGARPRPVVQPQEYGEII